MPLIISPRQLTQRAELFRQLASLIAAGVGLIPALEMVKRSPPTRAWRAPLTRLLGELNQGATFSDALRSLGRVWAPALDRALIEAGETSGRLDVCFRFLSEYYEERARLAQQAIGALAYPALVLHLAILIFPTTALTQLILQGDLVGYARSKLAILLPGYAAVLLVVSMAQAAQGSSWRSLWERFLRAMPILGAARDHLALARLSMALESLLNAGVSIVEAWELAAEASGSPALQRTVLGWRSRVLAGQTPAEAVRESRAFPDLFTNLYSTGEISGQLDTTLQRLYRHYQDEGVRKLRAVAEWLPRMVYFIVLLLVAYQIVSFWSAYYGRIGSMGF
ncbi:MAG: type II secretion system F family protein [Verrucomicrobiia bacterium]